MSTETKVMHPAVKHLLLFFNHDLLAAPLRPVSQGFDDLAHKLAAQLDGPELAVALRKLLEAKDAAVRARLASAMAQVVPL